MSMSGIQIDQSVNDVYKTLQKKDGGYKYMILRISEDRKNVFVHYAREHCSAEPKDKNYIHEIREMIAQDQKQCQWIITEINFSVVEQDSGNMKADRSKLVFIGWIPDFSSVRDRMVYASTQNGVAQKLKGIEKIISIKDLEDFDLENIVEMVRRK